MSQTQPTETAAKSKPKPAIDLKPFFGLVQAYRPPTHPDAPPAPLLPQRGAALLGAHMMLDLGRELVVSMKAADVNEYCTKMRAAWPMPWAAIELGGDVVRFVFQMGNMGGKARTERDYFQAMHELLSIEEREKREADAAARAKLAASVAAGK